MNRVEAAAILRKQARALERARPHLMTESGGVPWRLGFTSDRAVSTAARRTCAAWAWAARRHFLGTFNGWTHYRDGDGTRHDKGRTISPWERLNRFSAWASGLPGAKGKPGAGGCEHWLWAMETAAAALDSLGTAAAGAETSGGKNGGPGGGNGNRTPTLHPDEQMILRALAKAKTLQNQYDLESTTKRSRRTIGYRLKRLRAMGLVNRPNGSKGGEEITAKGRAHIAH